MWPSFKLSARNIFPATRAIYCIILKKNLTKTSYIHSTWYTPQWNVFKYWGLQVTNKYYKCTNSLEIYYFPEYLIFVACGQLVRPMEFPFTWDHWTRPRKLSLLGVLNNATGGADIKMLSRQRMYRPKYCRVTDLNFISLANTLVLHFLATKFK